LLCWPLFFLIAVIGHGLEGGPSIWISVFVNMVINCCYTIVYNINLSIFKFMLYLKSWLKFRRRKIPFQRKSTPCAYYRPGGIIGYKRKPRRLFILLNALSTTSHPRVTSIMDTGYDSDSFRVKVDNCCSSSFTNNLADIVGTPIPIRARVQGFGGTATPVTHRVTIQWNIEDDLGRRHTVTLPNSYYAPTGERLLSPQHWAQVAKDNYPKIDGTCCITTATDIKLMWGQQRFMKTVPLDPRSNIGVLRTASGFDKFRTFCAEVQECDDEVALTSQLEMAYDDEAYAMRAWVPFPI